MEGFGLPDLQNPGQSDGAQETGVLLVLFPGRALITSFQVVVREKKAGYEVSSPSKVYEHLLKRPLMSGAFWCLSGLFPGDPELDQRSIL